MAQSLEQYRTEYERLRRTRSGSDPDWLARAREQAFDRFLSMGFPSTRDEEWRFTSVAPIAERAFVLAGRPRADAIRPQLAALRLPLTKAELVFVNGHYEPTLSSAAALPAGVVAENLASASIAESGFGRLAPIEQQAFTALNTAFLADGAVIRIPAHVVVQEPIHVVFVSTGDGNGQLAMSHPRMAVVMGEASQASIVETYAGRDGIRYLTNGVTEISLGENAVLTHYKLQYESEDAYHIATMHVRADRGANFTSHSVSLGGALVRNDAIATLAGVGVECTLNGLYVADAQRHVDNHTTIDHAQPHCGSREIYKGILADRARGVFNGKIIVRPDAQKTDAKQTNRALLLSEDAQINTKPQLEIFANDVKCTHGAAVGQLEEEAVFYLRSRGLNDVQARQMLIQAFVGEVLQRLPSEAIRNGVDAVLQRHLARALPAA